MTWPIEIDPADRTLPENYLQLKAALDKDCEKWEIIYKAKKPRPQVLPVQSSIKYT